MPIGITMFRVYNNLTRSHKHQTKQPHKEVNTMNEFKTTLQLKRIDICDLMLACLAAKELANDDGKKWITLHDELKRQLNELDEQLTQIAKL